MKRFALLLVGLFCAALLSSCSKDSPTSPVPVAPTITAQPQSQTVGIGSEASFAVVAAGTPAPTYQWKLNGADIGGATNATYSIPSASFADSGTYSVVVSNSIGSATSKTATLSIIAGAPVITVQPQSQTVQYGTSATFSVVASGATALSYQWKKNGINIGGATAASFTIAAATLDDTGTYTVVLSTNVGSATSRPAVLTVIVPAPDLTVVGHWEGALAAIPLIHFSGEQIFAHIASDSTFTLISRDATRGDTLPIKDTTLVLSGTWRLNGPKDSILLFCDTSRIIDTAKNILKPQPVRGQTVPVLIKEIVVSGYRLGIAKSGEAIDWTIAMTDFIPVAPLLNINIPDAQKPLLAWVLLILEKKSQ